MMMMTVIMRKEGGPRNATGSQTSKTGYTSFVKDALDAGGIGIGISM
jgi:hypothetical protein